MNIFQSWYREVEDYRLRHKIEEFFNIRCWARVHKHRKQRIARGFSDQDMWDGGSYVMQVISDTLKWYDQGEMVDWSSNFRRWKVEGTNYGYSSLKQMYKDIDRYLAHEKTSWSTGLSTIDLPVDTTEIANDTGEIVFNVRWLNVRTGRVLKEDQITRRIKRYHEKAEKLKLNAVNAVKCWATHADSFWD